jgi:hypothetical protein
MVLPVEVQKVINIAHHVIVDIAYPAVTKIHTVLQQFEAQQGISIVLAVIKNQVVVPAKINEKNNHIYNNFIVASVLQQQ